MSGVHSQASISSLPPYISYKLCLGWEGVNLKLRRNIQGPTPYIPVVLVTFSCHGHVRGAFPSVNLFVPAMHFIQADQPAIWSGPDRQHWERIGELVTTDGKLEVLY